MPRKPSKKAIEKRISRIYLERCSGIQVNVFDLSKISDVGEAAVAEGADDQVLGDKIAAFVETIRQN